MVRGEYFLQKKDTFFIMIFFIVLFSLIGYTIYFFMTDVRVTPIEDSVLRTEILTELGMKKHEDDDKRPNKSDLKKLRALVIDVEDTDTQVVKNLEGIQHATELERLVIHQHEIDNLEPLESLPKLHTLNLSYFKWEGTVRSKEPERAIKDMEPLTKINSLKVLHLSGQDINDISMLGDMDQLEELYLGNNHIDSIPTSIQELEKLKVLYLLENNLVHIDALEDVVSLEVRDLEESESADFRVLSGMVSLTIFTTITTSDFMSVLSSLRGLESLGNLEISFLDGVDIPPLGDAPNLNKVMVFNSKIDTFE